MDLNPMKTPSEDGLGGSVQAQRLVESHSSSPVSPMTSTLSTEPAQAESPREGNRPPPPGINSDTTQHPTGHTYDNHSKSQVSNIRTLEPYEGAWSKVRNKRRQRRKERIIQQHLNIFTTEENHFPKYYKLKFSRVDIDTKLNVIAVDKEIKMKIGIPSKIKRLARNTLQIEVRNKEQGEKLMKLETITKEPITVEKHDAMNKVKGTVLSETMPNCTIEELKEALANQGVENIERMKRRTGNGFSDTNRYILTFNRTELPRIIQITDWHYEVVELYIPPPMKCMKCQRFGHLKKWCKREAEVCVRCGESGHTSQACLNDIKCLHCQGEHTSMDRKCPVYIFRSEIIATQTRERIPIKEAEEKVRETYRSEGKTYSFAVKSQNARPTQSSTQNQAQNTNMTPEPSTSSMSTRPKTTTMPKENTNSYEEENITPNPDPKQGEKTIKNTSFNNEGKITTNPDPKQGEKTNRNSNPNKEENLTPNSDPEQGEKKSIKKKNQLQIRKPPLQKANSNTGKGDPTWTTPKPKEANDYDAEKVTINDKKRPADDLAAEQDSGKRCCGASSGNMFPPPNPPPTPVRPPTGERLPRGTGRGMNNNHQRSRSRSPSINLTDNNKDPLNPENKQKDLTAEAEYLSLEYLQDY